jgi:hypothetical protein
MPSHGLYVYGLVRATDDVNVGSGGLEYEGRPGRVELIRVGRVAAVVSPYDARRHVLPLRRNLDPHHRVIREVMETSTIVPMTFGHVARSRRDVAKALRRSGEAIAAELERLRNTVEMGLKVRLEVDNVFKYIVEADPSLATYRDRVFGSDQPPAHADKLELGRLFEDRLRLERSRLTERVLDALGHRVLETRVNPPHGEETVADVAFLLKRPAMVQFEGWVRETAAGWPSQYAFQCTGPWAPFNFVALQLPGPENDADGTQWAS